MNLQLSNPDVLELTIIAPTQTSCMPADVPRGINAGGQGGLPRSNTSFFAQEPRRRRKNEGDEVERRRGEVEVEGDL